MLINGTTEYVAPSDICTNRLNTIIIGMASASTRICEKKISATPSTASAISKAFLDGSVRKEYLALVEGRRELRFGLIDGSVRDVPLAEVLALPEPDRAYLAKRLIASLDTGADEHVEEQWFEVIDR